QRELLDTYGRLDPLAEQVAIAHRVWLELLNRMLELESKARDREARLELLRYRVRELSALELKEGEAASLAEEHERLANRGRLAEATQAALMQLYEGDEISAHEGVSRAIGMLKNVSGVDPKIA